MAVADIPVTICERSLKIVVVSGCKKIYQTDEEIAEKMKENIWGLCSHILDKSERQRPVWKEKITVIVNQATNPWQSIDGNVDDLHKELIGITPSLNAITCIIFAHCHGAKVVHEAMQQSRLEGKLRSRGVPDAIEKIKQIRKNLAIITFGPTRYIGVSSARVALNFMRNDDRKAIAGQFINGKTNNERVIKILVKDGVALREETRASLWAKLQSLLIGASWSSSSDNGEMHHLRTYASDLAVREKCTEYLRSDGSK